MPREREKERNSCNNSWHVFVYVHLNMSVYTRSSLSFPFQHCLSVTLISFNFRACLWVYFHPESPFMLAFFPSVCFPVRPSAGLCIVRQRAVYICLKSYDVNDSFNKILYWNYWECCVFMVCLAMSVSVCMRKECAVFCLISYLSCYWTEWDIAPDLKYESHIVAYKTMWSWLI